MRLNSYRRPALVALVATVLLPFAIRAQCTEAVQLLMKKHLEDARAAVEARLASAPKDDAAMHCMGRILLDNGKPSDAVDWFQKAISLNSANSLHYLWLARAYGLVAESANALQRPFLAPKIKDAYEKAVALDHNSVDARRGLVTFYAQAPAAMGGGMDKAREQAAAILELNSLRGHIAYGYIAERENDFAGAAKEYLAATNAMPDSGVVARLSLGRVLITKLQDFDRGEKEIQLWLASVPKDATPVNISTAHYCLGLVHRQRGEKDKAQAEFRAALAANPNNEDAKKALSELK